ncbi:f-box domain-containing, partial [Trichoderma arundinaceum]
MATSAAGDEVVAAESKKRRISFVDLPTETQRDIVSHCSQSDLICLALVSRHFHELASTQLYRNFHIVFPDDDDLNFDSPIDGLAGGLDTFTTSNYDYAKHLRDLSMDTLSAGLKGENSYQSYLYSASCGKFLNTLLHLTLKKARSLEVFRWNIRVELSRPVYRELHRIASLKKLHVRMQAGESYYMQPPPLPVSIDAHPQPDVTNHWGSIPPLAPLTLLPPPPPPG